MKRFLRHLIKYWFILTNNRIKYARYLGVKVGNQCRIYIDEWGSEPDLISIGNNVTITKDVMLLTHDGSFVLYKDKSGNRMYRFSKIDIGNDIFIGVRTIVMPGVSICDQVIIGAGSLVTKSITKSGIYVGSPVRYLKPFKANAKC